MKMTKLVPVDMIQSGDFIKATTSQKAVPVQHCIGLRVSSVDLYMDADFEGFYRADKNDNVQDHY